MMGRDQYLDDKSQQGMPHLMFYVPNTVVAADWSANLPKSPVFGGRDPREPLITLIVPVTHWSDGSSAPPAAHE